MLRIDAALMLVVKTLMTKMRARVCVCVRVERARAVLFPAFAFKETSTCDIVSYAWICLSSIEGFSSAFLRTSFYSI